jgi:hypothetical protein
MLVGHRIDERRTRQALRWNADEKGGPPRLNTGASVFRVFI